MAQIQTKFIANEAVISTKIGSQSATSVQPIFADGSGGALFRSILGSDIPTLNQNTTGTAANITATSNSTLTTLTALTTASSLSISGSQVSGGTFGAVNGSALTNLSAAALSGVLPVGVTGGSGLSIATTQLTGDINLTSQVSGILPIANGGTNGATKQAGFDNLSPLGTAGDTLYYNGTHNVALGIGSSGQVLTVVSGEPAWATASSGSVTSVSVVSANGFAGTVATATSTPAITISTTLTTPVIAGNGTALIAATTTGTGSTVVLSASPTFTGTVSMAALAATTGSFTSAVNMNSNQINNLANGSASGDAINLGQLQAAISGLYWQGPAQAYADSNVPLTGGATLSIDSYPVQNGDLVILGNQTTASQNGEYTASGIGSAYVLTPNGLPTAAGDAWLILNGTVYADSAFVANAAVPAATFTEFAGPTAYVFSAPLLLTGRTVSITQATTSTDGYLSSTDWNTFNNKQPAGAYITALTGDATASGPGSATLTLATVNSDVGSFGSSTSIPSFTVNAKGLITAASGNAVVAPAGTLSGTTLNSTVVSSSLTSVGTIGTGTWQGTAVGIAYGGTGQTTANAAFDALSPMTTAGDLVYENATPTATRLAIGSTGQILTVVGGLPAWASAAATSTATEDVLTLSPTDITNQYKDLNYPVIGNSATVNSISLGVYGGPEQLKGTDYTVSLTGGAGGVTRITFAGDLATGGNSALVSGDILMVEYTTASSPVTL